MSRELKLSLLVACLDLPLTPEETALMREIAVAYSANMQSLWGATNLHRVDEVRALFSRCEELIRVSQTQV